MSNRKKISFLTFYLLYEMSMRKQNTSKRLQGLHTNVSIIAFQISTINTINTINTITFKTKATLRIRVLLCGYVGKGKWWWGEVIWWVWWWNDWWDDVMMGRGDVMKVWWCGISVVMWRWCDGDVTVMWLGWRWSVGDTMWWWWCGGEMMWYFTLRKCV
jgi:hypothetical protein